MHCSAGMGTATGNPRAIGCRKRYTDSMTMFLRLAGLLILWSAGLTAGDSAELSGRVMNVVDGDDFVLCVGGTCTQIRLCGIDAPEQGCAGCRDARDALRALVEGKERPLHPSQRRSVCDGRSRSTSGKRIVAQCFLDNTDIAGALVERGLACDWER